MTNIELPARLRQLREDLIEVAGMLESWDAAVAKSALLEAEIAALDERVKVLESAPQPRRRR